MAIKQFPDLGSPFHRLNGTLADGYRLYIYENETTTDVVTYSDYQGGATHTQPIIIQPDGLVPSQGLYADDSILYTAVLRDELDAPIRTIDGIRLIDSGSGSGSGVQSDWNETDIGSDAYILNKPVTITPAESAKLTNVPADTNAELALKIDLTEKANPNGVATLQGNGKIPASQLPAYVDEVLETYIVGATPFASDWLSDSEGGAPLTPVDGIIYIVLTAGEYEDQQYRWGGSMYVNISGSDLQLGETSTTAYRGDRGKIAYDHSLLTSGNPHNVSASDIPEIGENADDIADNVIDITTNFDDIASMLAGTIVDTQTITFVKDGGLWYAEMEKEGGGNLTVDIAGAYYILDCTTNIGTDGKARSPSISLGTLTAPSNQFFWVELNTGIAEIKVGSQIDLEKAVAPAGVAVFLDDAFTVAENAYYYQRFNDSLRHGDTQRGLISEMAERIRIDGTRVYDGLEANINIVPVGGAIDSAQIAINEGIVYQLHPQIVPAQLPPITYFVANDPTTPFKQVADLGEINLDSQGGSLHSNGSWYGLNIAITVSSESRGIRVLVYLPTDSYNNQDDAVGDIFKYSGVTASLIGQIYLTRICRVVLGYTNGNSGTLTNALGGTITQDERNQTAGSGGGGGASLDYSKFPFIPQTIPPLPVSEGTTFYSERTHNLVVQTAINNSLDVGREFYTRVYNNTGATLSDGMAVYVNGAAFEDITTSVATAALARADDLATATTVGVMTGTVLDGAYGEICMGGYVNNIDTNGLTAGDLLFISGTVAGELTSTPPSSLNPNHYDISVGRVNEVNPITGSILVKVEGCPDISNAISVKVDKDLTGYGATTSILNADSHIYIWNTNTTLPLVISGSQFKTELDAIYSKLDDSLLYTHYQDRDTGTTSGKWLKIGEMEVNNSTYQSGRYTLEQYYQDVSIPNGSTPRIFTISLSTGGTSGVVNNVAMACNQGDSPSIGYVLVGRVMTLYLKAPSNNIRHRFIVKVGRMSQSTFTLDSAFTTQASTPAGLVLADSSDAYINDKNASSLGTNSTGKIISKDTYRATRSITGGSFIDISIATLGMTNGNFYQLDANFAGDDVDYLGGANRWILQLNDDGTLIYQAPIYTQGITISIVSNAVRLSMVGAFTYSVNVTNELI